jgi:hypothetical protein
MRTGALAWVVVAGLAAATLAGAGRDEAWADGAIAVGTTGEGTTADVVLDGIAFGMAVNVSKDMAGEIAVKRCRTFEARKAAERCKVVATFSGECFAIAYDPQPGTPGAGWGVGPDQLAANQRAVAMCEQAAGPARKGYCQVERFGCDTTPKPDAKPDAHPVPGTDAKTAPDSKAAPDTKEAKDAKDVKDTKEAKVGERPVEPAKEAKEATKDTKAAKQVQDSKESKDSRESKRTKEAEETKEAKDDPKTNIAKVAPLSPSPEPAPKPGTAADPPRSSARSPAAPLLPVLALAGVGLAYAAGQHLRGRLKNGLAERQIITGGALAVAAAIATKLADMAGASETVAAALAGLFALGAALLA